MTIKDQVLIIVGDASETVDTLYPYYRLQEGGYTPVVAGPEKRKFQMVLHEVKPGWTITKEWEGYTIDAEIAFRDINPADYVGIFFSGGRGCINGRRMTTVAKCRFDVEVCGGIYVNEPCVIDRNLVSGRTFHDHGKYMGAWMTLLDQERTKLSSGESSACKVAVTS